MKFVPATALLALFSGSALAAPVSSSTFTSVPSYKLAGNAGNAKRTIEFGVQNTTPVRQIKFSGALAKVNGSTLPRDAAIRCRRYVHLSPQVQQLTHEFVAQPFPTTVAFNGNEAVVPAGAFVLPVPQDLVFNGAFSAAAMNVEGHWEFEFFEQSDQNAGDNSSTPDAIWSSVTITLDDAAPATATAAPITGTVGATSRFGVRSDDTLGPGQFSGGFIGNLATPANATRIKHARVTGYVTGLTVATAADSVSSTPVAEARVRLRRSESVQLSPGDIQPFTSNDDVTVELPISVSSSGFVDVNIPIAANDDFGKLTRNVPTSENETYYGFSYYANFYEANDDGAAPDNVWNWVKIELFSDAQPPTPMVDAGVLNPSAGQSLTFTRQMSVESGDVYWMKFELPQGVSDAAGTWLDIDTEGSFGDTLLGLYGTAPANVGDRLSFDDDDGSGQFSQLSFGEVGPRAATGDSSPRNGRDGSLAAGTYYVAAVPYVTGIGSSALGTTDFNVTNTRPSTETIRLTLKYGKLNIVACGPADVGSAGGVAGADGVLDNNDFIVFINQFFEQLPSADRGQAGGLPGGDGVLDNNDFIVFISQFFAGC